MRMWMEMWLCSLRALLCQDGVTYNSSTQLPDLVWHLNLEAGNWGAVSLDLESEGANKLLR